jgi:16S rRNA (uracil1498-N3)-methyltransferase
LVVQKLVELGIDDIRPFAAERSVVRWDEAKATKNQQRLERVAREAVMQCRRAWVPVVHPVVAFDDVAHLTGAARADLGGAPVSLDHPVVLVGPEGGWTAAERAVDVPVVALSGAVLRAETAAITAGALLAARRDLDH